ncbi:hypothetical protein EMIT0P12_80016 [Pseudomonas sp. IT-P12]
MVGTETRQQVRPRDRLQPQHFGVDQRPAVGQRLRPAAALVEHYAVEGDDGTYPALRRDVLAPFQFGQRLTQRAAADLEFLSQLMLARQQKAVLQEAAFDAPDELVDHPLFFVKSYLSNHVQIEHESIGSGQGIFAGDDRRRGDSTCGSGLAREGGLSVNVSVG